MSEDKTEYEVNRQDERRLARVSLNMRVARLLVTEGTQVITNCVKGVPVDAEWVGEYFDVQSMCVCFVFRHPSFGVVPPGEILPMLSIEYQVLETENQLFTTYPNAQPD